MTSSSPIVRLPLVAMAAVLAGLTVVALVLASDAAFRHWGWWRLSFFAIPVVVAGYYLNEYRKLPYEPWHFFPPRPTPDPGPGGSPDAPPSPSTAPAAAPVAAAPPTPPPAADDEPFIDPVEEADRLSQERRVPEPDAPDSAPPGESTEPSTPGR